MDGHRSGNGLIENGVHTLSGEGLMNKLISNLGFTISRSVPYATCLFVGTILGGVGATLVVRHIEMDDQAHSDVLYVSESPSQPQPLSPLRMLTRDDLNRCYNILKPNGFPSPQMEIKGAPVVGHPEEMSAGEIRNTTYTNAQLRQCIHTLDQLTSEIQPGS